MLKIQIALKGIFTKKVSTNQREEALFARDQFQRLSARKMKMPVSVIHL
jgi:hypothetical protein